MNKWLFVSAIVTLMLSCSTKKKETEKVDTSQYFPILSYLKSQVKALDTSMYRFIKIETADGKTDTSDISREDVRKYANDFLEIPDITDSDYGSDYSALTSYDSLMGRVFMSYTAYDKDVEVVKQDVTILPRFGDGADEVKTVYIEKIKSDDDKTIEKKMLWEMKKYFNIITITQKENAPEKIHSLKIEWNSSQWNE